MEIGSQGKILSATFCEGVIRSVERMTYTAVNQVLEKDPEQQSRYSGMVPHFERMKELAMILSEKRRRRGSIDFDLPEAVIQFDELGTMTAITRSERNAAHRLIEEFMLAANETVAAFLEQAGLASLHRIHEQPEFKKVAEFEQIASTFGYSLGVGPLPIQRFSLEGRAAVGAVSRGRRLNCRPANWIFRPQLSATGGKDFREGRGAHPVLPNAALAEAGMLPRNQHRTFRPGDAMLYPFHLSHSPLPGPCGAPNSKNRPGGWNFRVLDARRKARLLSRKAFTEGRQINGVAGGKTAPHL